MARAGRIADGNNFFFSASSYISVVTAYLDPPAVQPGWINRLVGDVTHPLAITLKGLA